MTLRTGLVLAAAADEAVLVLALARIEIEGRLVVDEAAEVVVAELLVVLHVEDVSMPDDIHILRRFRARVRREHKLPVPSHGVAEANLRPRRVLTSNPPLNVRQVETHHTVMAFTRNTRLDALVRDCTDAVVEASRDAGHHKAFHGTSPSLQTYSQRGGFTETTIDG